MFIAAEKLNLPKIYIPPILMMLIMVIINIFGIYIEKELYEFFWGVREAFLHLVKNLWCMAEIHHV